LSFSLSLVLFRRIWFILMSEASIHKEKLRLKISPSRENLLHNIGISGQDLRVFLKFVDYVFETGFLTLGKLVYIYPNAGLIFEFIGSRA
jgi:hypothetical protein